MKKESNNYLKSLVTRYPLLKECEEAIMNAYRVLEDCFLQDRKLLIGGNGGSYADSEHIVGELMKGFKNKRKCPKDFSMLLEKIDKKRGKELSENLQVGLQAISLGCHQSLNTAFANDVPNGGVLTFAQQVYGYGRNGDVFLGISTSGNSENIINAAIVSKAKGMKIIALTGQNGGELAKVSDVAIKVPSCETYIVQELHLPVYHCLCLMLEERFFD